MPDEQLKQELESAHQTLFNLRFQAATRQLANNSEVAKARKRIARVRTLLKEREILAEIDAAKGKE
ncbi:MAG: 50S ribosomal protein L29 [Dehalococcoidia bacterium]|nr:MAG: 50S ribosomal protein L29 [Dehalococcoidia bacterium]